MAEDDKDALFEVSDMLQVSDQIRRIKSLTKSAQTGLTKRLKDGENAKIETISEDFEAGGQKLSGKAKLVERTRQAREAKKASLPSEATTEREIPKTNNKRLAENEILEELGKLEKALEEVNEEGDKKLREKSENSVDARDKAQHEEAETLTDFPSAAVLVEKEKTNMIEEGEKVIDIVRKDHQACECEHREVEGTRTVDEDSSEDGERPGGVSMSRDHREKVEMAEDEERADEKRSRKMIRTDLSRSDESGQTSVGDSIDDEETEAASQTTKSTIETEICIEIEATVGPDKDEKNEKTIEICDVNHCADSAVKESQKDSLKFTKGDQAKDEIPPKESKCLKDAQKEEKIKESCRNSESRKDSEKKRLETKNQRNIYEEEEEVMIPGSSCEEKEAEIQAEENVQVMPEITDDVSKDHRKQGDTDGMGSLVIEKAGIGVYVDNTDKFENDCASSENDTHLKNTDLREETELTKCSLNDKEENQVGADYKSLESPEVSENGETKTATDEISPESLLFADCGPMKPVNFVEEFSFTTKCDINKEKDCLDETPSAETKWTDDHGRNRKDLLGQPESGSSQYRGREEEMMPSSILLLHDTRVKTNDTRIKTNDTRIKTDDGAAGSFKKVQKGSRPQITEENQDKRTAVKDKDKHTAHCSVAKDGKHGSTALHKRKQDEETCDFRGAKKPRKLHCQCLQPSSGDEIRCMLCSERYCD